MTLASKRRVIARACNLFSKMQEIGAKGAGGFAFLMTDAVKPLLQPDPMQVIRV